jgi:tetratricopeptide (TPR) repeat protein
LGIPVFESYFCRRIRRFGNTNKYFHLHWFFRVANVVIIMNRIAKLKEYLQSSPADNFLQHALALEYIKEGNDTEARTLFESILQRDGQYVGSYYHLAKLLERISETELAIEWYEKGMIAAKQAGDNHSYNELQMAHEDLVY